LIEIYLSRVVEARAIRVCLVSRDFLCLLSPLFRFNHPLFINHHHPRHPSPAAFANTRQHRLTFSTNQPQQQLTTMSAATKKSASTKPAAKKSASKSAPSHPSWVDMIKECIVDNPEDSRTGVSRPQIKKYVEAKYKLEIGAAQNTQLAKAISTGAEKGTFVLPKGAQFFIAPLRSGFNSGIVQVSAAR
jgi:hypothetical protein